MVIDDQNKQKTIQYLTDLMGVIQNAYYKRGLFMPLEYDSNSKVRGGLRVHEGSEGGISIDLYHFEGDGKPVCDGLKPCTITYDDGSHDIGHLFCMHYDPDDVTPLVFLFSHDEYGDGGDIDVEPESVPADVLHNIVCWIEEVFADNQYESYIISHEKGEYSYRLYRHAFASYSKAQTATLYGVTEQGEKTVIMSK